MLWQPQIWLSALACLASLTFSMIVQADGKTLRIGTGGSAGTYFPIGSIISESISAHAGAAEKSEHFVPDLLAIAQRSTGSGSNVDDINEGLLEAGLAQADVVHWAFSSTGPYENQPSRENLRGLASLYLESVHFIARVGSGIRSMADLPGKRVSLDEEGSGTRLQMVSVLEAFRISPSSFNVVYLKVPDAIERLRKNELDAFFVVAGYPVKAVTDLVKEGSAVVLPIEGQPVQTLSGNFPFFSQDSIPNNTYNNTENINTLGVPAQLIISKQVDEELAYNITGLLWSKETQNRLKRGHPKGSEIDLESALAGMVVPLHPGAKRFYEEQGLSADE